MNILSIDIGFRNTGWVISNETRKISTCGVIKNTDTSIIEITCSQQSKSINKIENKIKNKSKYKINQYSEIIKSTSKKLSDIIDNFDIETIVCEIPSSGSKSSRAQLMMGYSSSMIITLAAIKNIDIELFQPIQCKQIIYETLLIPKKVKTDKNMSIDTMKRLHPNLIIPKQKYFQEHIADAIIVMEMFFKQNYLKIRGIL